MKKTEMDTKNHIDKVKSIGMIFIKNIGRRFANHDKSKLEEPELSMFDKYTDRLSELEYGTPEYKECLNEMKKDALLHHYENNSHHPEHYENGVYDMDIVDIIEMCIDWSASCERTKDGDYFQSLQINFKRFDIQEPFKTLIIGLTKYFYKNYVEVYNQDNELIYLCGGKDLDTCMEKIKTFLDKNDYEEDIETLKSKFGFYCKYYEFGKLNTDEVNY